MWTKERKTMRDEETKTKTKTITKTKTKTKENEQDKKYKEAARASRTTKQQPSFLFEHKHQIHHYGMFLNRLISFRTYPPIK